jgi:hypothetical protein
MNYDKILILDLYNQSLFKKIKMNIKQKNKNNDYYEEYIFKKIVKWNNRYAISAKEHNLHYSSFYSNIHIDF